MSVVVTVAAAGYVAAQLPVLTAMASVAAAALGLKVVDEGLKSGTEEEQRAGVLSREARAELERLSEVEISTSARSSLEQVTAERCTLTFAGDKVTLKLTRDIRGKLTVRAHGVGVSRQELSERASAMLGLILQQVAYREAVATLRKRGFEIDHEERDAQGTARVRLVQKKGQG